MLKQAIFTITFALVLYFILNLLWIYVLPFHTPLLDWSIDFFAEMTNYGGVHLQHIQGWFSDFVATLP